jgi:hypothetical protein
MTDQPGESTQISQLIDSAWNSRSATLNELTRVMPEDLECKISWRDQESNIRHLLIRLCDHDYEHRLNIRLALALAGWWPTETQLLVAEGSAARGETLAILAGLTDDALDRRPAVDEWSPRETIGHLVTIEQRYSTHVEFSARRFREGKDPTETPATLGPIEATIEGDVAAIREQLVKGREQVNRAFSGLPDKLLVASTKWSDWQVDLRFRFHRYAAHEREHANQIRKALPEIGYQPTEVAMLLGQAEIARSAMLSELIGVPDALLTAAGPSNATVEDSLISASIDEIALVERIVESLPNGA